MMVRISTLVTSFVGNILELINANHNFESLLLCNFLGKVKHLVWIALYIVPIEIDRHLICRISANRNLWHKVREKAFCVLYGLLPLA